MDATLEKVIKAIEGEIDAFSEVMDVSKFRELQGQLEKFLITDPLTGVLNRRKFEEVLQREICSAITLKKPLCLMMIDVDKFKNHNDSLGHNAGDQILKQVAVSLEEIAEGTSGKSHYLGRWGGDEFLYIFPLKTIKQTKIIAEKMRACVSDTSSGAVGISIGIASLKNEDSVSTLIAVADGAMYVAKSMGGNAVIIDGQEQK